MDKATKTFLSRYPELKYDRETKKVKCSLSGHEMPCRLELLQSYVGGKKFLTLKSHKDYDFQRLEPLIVSSTRRKHQLFCALTNRYINRKPNEVESHLQGKRYKSALEKYNAGRLELFKERVRKSKQQDEVLTSVDGQTSEHTIEESSAAHLTENNNSEATLADDGDAGDAFWMPDEAQSGDGSEDDSRNLDPEFHLSDHDDDDGQLQGGGRSDIDEAIEEEQAESVGVDAQEDKVGTKRVNRKRKAKLALLKSRKKAKVTKTSLITNPRKSKTVY